METRVTRSQATSPFYGEAGWVHWPDNEEYSFEFLRVLATAQEGAGTLSECFRAAALITPGDKESWYRAWKQLADLNKTRGDEAFARNGSSTAASNWLRASNYYRTAEAFMDVNDLRRKQLVRNMKICSRLYLEKGGLNGKVATIACDGGQLQGYFIKSPGAADGLPVVICVGALGVRKDELLHTMRASAAANGLSLLLIDSAGTEAVRGGRCATSRIEIETAISRWVDYLQARPEVDPFRIAIYGDGLGAPYATKAASRDHRFAAAVCDGGLWESHERSFFRSWISQGGNDRASRPMSAIAKGSFAANVQCPALMTIGEHDYVTVEHAVDVHRTAQQAGADLTLKVFSAEETAAAPGHADNPTLAREFIFGWLREKLDQTEAAFVSPVLAASRMLSH